MPKNRYFKTHCILSNCIADTRRVQLARPEQGLRCSHAAQHGSFLAEVELGQSQLSHQDSWRGSACCGTYGTRD